MFLCEFFSFEINLKKKNQKYLYYIYIYIYLPHTYIIVILLTYLSFVYLEKNTICIYLKFNKISK